MLTLSKAKKSQGAIKGFAEDFIVEEIAPNGILIERNKIYTRDNFPIQSDAVAEQKFSVFILQKMNWNTVQALRAVAKRFRRGIRSTGFAGTKDRNSISTQMCSIYGVTPEMLASVHVKDTSINGAWPSSTGVKLGDLLGNRFTIKIRDIKEQLGLDGILGELNNVFPNYFGEQRFGNRENNAQIGIDILRGDFESAAMHFLTDCTNEISQDAIEARQRLDMERDFKSAIEYFPSYLKYERAVIEYLHRFAGNYANAMRMLPRAILLMFVHSVEDYLFNKELEMRVKDGLIGPQGEDLVCEADFYGFPALSKTRKYGEDGYGKEVFVVGNIVGYDTELNSIERDLLEELGIDNKMFALKRMPELNCKGSHRVFFAPFKDFNQKFDENGNLMLSFSLPAGSYATTLLKEFVDYETKQMPASLS